MDRALNEELLRKALGTPQELPSAEALAELLAQAEVQLFIRRPELGDRLLATAWYLHGIGSATAAASLYPIDRRRAAFQVAAHIFDLALERPDLSQHLRLRYAFAAQIGYLRSELSPNALAIYRRLELQPDTIDVQAGVDETALTLGCTILGFKRAAVYPLLDNIRQQLIELATLAGTDDLESTIFAPLPGIVEGCYRLMRYLLRGNPDDLSGADVAFLTAVRSAGGSEYLDARWVAAHLREIGHQLGSTSVWAVLPPTVPEGAKRAFTYGDPPVLTLWPPQAEIVSAHDPDPSPLDPTVRRILLSVPTSTGKTLISQLFTLVHLAKTNRGVCYVVPTRSLAREVRRALLRRLRVFGRNVLQERDDWSPLDPELEHGAIEVLTPERLAHLIRTDLKSLLERFTLFIFDEAHTLADQERGLTLESAIALLHWLTKDTEHRLMLMSAAIGNKGLIRTWIDPTNTGAFRDSAWRGPRRLYAVYNTQADWGATTVEPNPKARKWTQLQRTPVYGEVRLRLSATGSPRSVRTKKPVGTFDRLMDSAGNFQMQKENPTKTKSAPSSTPFYKRLASILPTIGEAGPVLAIRSTRPQTRELADALADELPETNEAQALARLIRDRLGEKHPLAKVVSKGVAFHHAGLPSDILDAIEDAVRQQEIRYVVATSTLTEGVNLPVRTVVLVDDAGERIRPLTGSQIINAVGRAGRACMESEGWVVLARPFKATPDDFKRLQPTDADIEVKSVLATDEALSQVEEFENLLRESYDAVFEMAGTTVSNFVSFVWLILTANEELGRSYDEAALKSALSYTLAWKQLPDEQRQRWQRLGMRTREAYAQSDPARRRRWGRIGTSVGAARMMDELSQRLADGALGREGLSDPYRCLDLLIETRVLDELLNRPEAKPVQVFNVASGKRIQLEVDLIGLLRRWLDGAEPGELAEEFLKDVRQSDFRFEQLGDLIEVFEHYLSWTVATVIGWTNSELERRGHEYEPLCPDLGPFIRHGLHLPLAARLLREGVRSRRLANRVAAVASEVELDDLPSARDWLREIGPVQWRARLEATPAEVADLLELTRADDAHLLARVLNGREATVTVHPERHMSEGIALLILDKRAPNASEVVLEQGSELFSVPTEHQAELFDLVELGLPLEVRLRREEKGQWTAAVRLGQL